MGKSAFSSHKTQQQGMTLLEVMVAIAIFAIAALALMQSISAQLVAIADLETKTFAGWVADNQLAELRLEEVWPDTNWHNGSTQMGNHMYYWRWQGKTTSDDLIREVDIEVRDSDHTRSPNVTLQSFLLKPTKK